MPRRTQAERGVGPPQRESLRATLVELAQVRFRDQVVDALEIEHLVDIATNYSLLLSDIYEPAKIEKILHRADPMSRWLARLELGDKEQHPESLLRLRQVPDQIKTVADKCLYDVGVFQRDSYRGVSLKDLGMASYKMASQILEILAEDRRLRDYFRSNTMGKMPIEDEIIFLRQCAHRFSVHADLLKHLGLINPDDAPNLGETGPVTGTAASPQPVQPAPAAPDPAWSSPLARDSGARAGPFGELARASLVLAPIPSATLERRRPVPAPSGTDAEAPRPADRALAAAEGSPTAPQAERLALLERMMAFSALPIEALRGRLKKIVIDQDDAVDALCDEFSLYATGTQNPRRPSSYLFAGPTGVGKNYLIETLAALLQQHWGEEVPFLLLEGPNFTYPSDINELRGATRGFIRSDEEGVLTEFHHRSSRVPFAVILVDEVEKSHAQLQRFFLGVMDRGTVTDNRGQTLRFSNTLLVFTSNLGYSRLQQQSAPIGYQRARGARRYPRKEIDQEIKKALSPEFLNRLVVLHFAPLSRTSIARIFDLELDKIASLYERIHGLSLEVTNRAKEALIELGYSDDYGARYLANALQRHCNVEVSKKLKRDEVNPERNPRPVLDYLREVRSGQRVYRERDTEQLVYEQARVRVPYRRLRIDHRAGEFSYETLGRRAR